MHTCSRSLIHYLVPLTIWRLSKLYWAFGTLLGFGVGSIQGVWSSHVHCRHGVSDYSGFGSFGWSYYSIYKIGVSDFDYCCEDCLEDNEICGVSSILMMGSTKEGP